MSEYFSEKELEMLNIPEDEKKKMIKDYENFKKSVIPNPVHDLIHNAIVEFNGLLYTYGYEQAVKSTKKYLEKFLEFVRNDEVLKADDIIADYVYEIIEKDKISEVENVDLLMYTDDNTGNAVNSMIVVNIKRPVVANVSVKFSDGFTLSYKKKIPSGIFVVLLTTSKISGEVIKKAFIV